MNSSLLLLKTAVFLLSLLVGQQLYKGSMSWMIRRHSRLLEESQAGLLNATNGPAEYPDRGVPDPTANLLFDGYGDVVMEFDPIETDEDREIRSWVFLSHFHEKKIEKHQKLLTFYPGNVPKIIFRLLAIVVLVIITRV
ncbi:MAG TPA: hypothetical protein VMV52_07015 [Candidatus Nanopelagicaceae bacterium]|nr:hypothetical protein [Candidatus Nanopelagicaceae bacterium]